MNALPNALVSTSSSLRTMPADPDAGLKNDSLSHSAAGQTFEETIQAQSTSDDTPVPDTRVGDVEPRETEALPTHTARHTVDQIPETSDEPIVDKKADIIPIADVNGTEDSRPDIPQSIRTAPPSALATANTVTHPAAIAAGQTHGMDRMAPDLRIVPGSAQAGFPLASGNRGPTGVHAPASSAPEVMTGPGNNAPAIIDTADLIASRSGANPVAVPQGQQPQAEGIIPQTQTTEPLAPQNPTPQTLAVQTTANPSSPLTPVTVGIAPADGAQSDIPNPRLAKAEATPIADVTGDIDAPRSHKGTPTLTEPVRPNVETLRASDLPTISTLPTASADTLATPKTLPLTPQPPMLTQMSGFGERLISNYMQPMPNSVAVTVDKLPQTVVALTLNAQSATLQIDPPELGRIQLEYQFDTQGRTVVTLVPESEAARAALMDRMAAISAALSQNASGEIDVRMGDASDFAFSDGDNATNEGHTEPNGRRQDSADSQSVSTGVTPTSPHYFSRGSSGQTDRLHILV